MKEKFTQGEWCLFGDWAVKRKGTTEILFSFEERGFNNQEGFANAHLIAAAPDMYALLKQWFDDGYMKRSDVEKLLSKARGES